MPLFIKDNQVASLVGELAVRLGTTKQNAVKQAVQAALDKSNGAESFQEKLDAFYARNPMPPRTGERADKAFFDDLSGEFD